jgi:G3E family GTPase
VVDAETILENLDSHEGLARAQISVAYIVLVNKVDLVDEARIDAIQVTFEAIIPQAHLLMAEQARVPLDLLIDTGRFDPQKLTFHDAKTVHVHDVAGESHHHAHDLIFDTWSWVSLHPLSLGNFGEFIEQLPKSIVRVKGLLSFVERTGQIGELHIVGNRATLKMRVLDNKGDPVRSQLVFIGEHGGIDADGLLKRMQDCVA